MAQRNGSSKRDEAAGSGFVSFALHHFLDGAARLAEKLRCGLAGSLVVSVLACKPAAGMMPTSS
ncbi:hypothetical protein B8V81_1349 [Paenibacillus pasadenensis]|uniref:Uncharacterized protein n=1 Tax=Paenibacillus pasadenensis TaxID=217090 RepID=A0A2N5N9X8_9BACL|nr:hypothetical protein B8V81_1349 [Paenibacillus pasadenensis]